MNKPNKIILHCAATDDSRESKHSVEDIDRWHKKRGWRGIGYHYYITRDGEIHKGRDDNAIGAHTRGQNDQSIGICYEGSYFPTIDQWLSLIHLYRQFRNSHNFGANEWHCHNEYAKKSCPGFDVESLRSFLSKIA